MESSSQSLSYDEALRLLNGLRLHGLKLGLDNTRRLAALAGDPHRRLRFIHVAGTNGKGSTCAFLESMCRAAGLRTGLFTSPHLVSFRERIQVNRNWIRPDELVARVRELQGWLRLFPSDHSPTFFEAATIIALRHFEAAACDVVILETGMGGRLDATNIVTPLVSVITNIDLDHQSWLGPTRADIAREKAGIIKPGVPVCTAAGDPEALEVIRQTALDRGAPVVRITPNDLDRPPLDRLAIPLAGRHQRFNAALALAALDQLAPVHAIPEPARASGLTRVEWPGRMQLVPHESGAEFLLDGAHNPAGAAALAAGLRAQTGDRRCTLIIGTLGDKDWAPMCDALAPIASRILTVPIRSDRTADPARLQAHFRSTIPGVPADSCSGLREALGRIGPDELAVVTGSLYLVGEALELLGVVPPETPAERELNEWSARI